MRRWGGLALALIALTLPRCAATPAGPEHAAQLLPEPHQIVSAYNARVARLESIWANTELRLEFKDEEGRDVDEQAEGHLQMVRPRRFAMSVTKLGEPYFYLGSNESEYWWLDLTKDKHAIVGRHDAPPPEAWGDVTLGLSPLEVVELLGITPLPAEGLATRWSADGRSIEASLSGTGTIRTLLLDPQHLWPVAIELRSSDGTLAARSDLERYASVPVRDDAGARPMMATRITIHHVRDGARVVIALYNQQNRPLPDLPFNLDELKRRYGITRVEGGS